MNSLIKKIIAFGIIVSAMFFNSCKEPRQRDIKKEILGFVLNDRMKLEYSVNIFPDTNDTIEIANITLIENTYSDFKIDPDSYRLRIFSGNTPPLSHQFFLNSEFFIYSQIMNAKFSYWDTTSLNIDVEIDSPLKVVADSVEDKTVFWIGQNEEKTFLQISEPIYNVNGEVLVSAVIELKGYRIDKSYILKRKDQSWEIIDFSTLITKITEPEVIRQYMNLEGEEVVEEVQYHIVVGYYDL